MAHCDLLEIVNFFLNGLTGMVTTVKHMSNCKISIPNIPTAKKVLSKIPVE